MTIEEIEKHIIEIAFEKGFVKAKQPHIRTGKKIAVVGSGPAGLAAAAQLNYAGHTVTVFERDDAPGGLLRYGIPDFKLEKWVVDRRIKLMEQEGIVFKCNANVGVNISINELMQGISCHRADWRFHDSQGSYYSRPGSERRLFCDGIPKAAKQKSHGEFLYQEKIFWPPEKM